MVGAVVNLAGKVMARHELAVVRAQGRRRRWSSCIELAAALIALTDRPVLGVGVGSPGVVDAEGTVVDAPNLGWTDTPLARTLQRELGVPVFVANDANTAALGEHTFGDAGDGGLMVLRVGTGVGAGLVLEGALLHGHRAAAGEIGHVVVDPRRRAAARAAAPAASRPLLAVPQLRRRLGGGRATPTTCWRRLGEQLGAALAPVVGTLNLHELVLSGPPDLLDGPLREAADRDHPRADHAGHRRAAGRADLDPRRRRGARGRRGSRARRTAGGLVTPGAPRTADRSPTRSARQDSPSSRDWIRGSPTISKRGTLRCA